MDKKTHSSSFYNIVLFRLIKKPDGGYGTTHVSQFIIFVFARLHCHFQPGRKKTHEQREIAVFVAKNIDQMNDPIFFFCRTDLSMSVVIVFDRKTKKNILSRTFPCLLCIVQYRMAFSYRKKTQKIMFHPRKK